MAFYACEWASISYFSYNKNLISYYVHMSQIFLGLVSPSTLQISFCLSCMSYKKCQAPLAQSAFSEWTLFYSFTHEYKKNTQHINLSNGEKIQRKKNLPSES